MCLIDCNIVEVENKEVKRNSDVTYEERCKIEFMINKKYTMQEIAEELGRNKSVISREINRHSEEKWNYNTGICKRVYSAAVAQGKYEYSKKKLKISPLDLVHKAKLKKKDKREEKEEKLPKHKEKSIHKRPKEIDENKEFGHWELDCVEGSKDNKKTYMTLLERLTKKYIVIEMREHTSECVKQAVDRLEERYGNKFRKIFKSMTTDNGHEFLNYDKIEISKIDKNQRRTIVYYADPYSSWQKGMNENCNGILRRFIPKGTDLNKISSEKLEKILSKINGKPRKILGFISADKRFNEEINKIVA